MKFISCWLRKKFILFLGNFSIYTFGHRKGCCTRKLFGGSGTGSGTQHNPNAIVSITLSNFTFTHPPFFDSSLEGRRLNWLKKSSFTDNFPQANKWQYYRISEFCNGNGLKVCCLSFDIRQSYNLHKLLMEKVNWGAGAFTSIHFPPQTGYQS